MHIIVISYTFGMIFLGGDPYFNEVPSIEGGEMSKPKFENVIIWLKQKKNVGSAKAAAENLGCTTGPGFSADNNHSSYAGTDQSKWEMDVDMNTAEKE